MLPSSVLALARLGLTDERLDANITAVADKESIVWADLRDNALVDPWDALLKLPNLSYLMLGGNRIREVSAKLNQLTRLNSLRLNRNRIKFVPPLPQVPLLELDLTENLVIDLPAASLGSLQSVWLCHNLLPPAFSVEIEHDRFRTRRLLAEMVRTDARPAVEACIATVLGAWVRREGVLGRLPRDVLRLLLDRVWDTRYDRALWIRAKTALLEREKKCVIS